MRRFAFPDRRLLRIGEIDAGAPDHVFAELSRPIVAMTRVMKRAHDVVENFLAVQCHHRLEAVLRHHVDRAAAGDRHPHLDRQMLRARHAGDVLEIVAAIRHPWRAFVILALVMELLLVEALQQELQLLLEQLAIGVGVKQWRAERLDLARVIAAPDAHDDAPVGDDIRHRVILGEADRMPHRQNVEGAAEFEPPRLRCEPQPPLDQIGDALIAFALEVMLRAPEAVIACFVHDARDVERGLKHLRQPLVRVAPLVRRRAVEADIVELDLPDIERVKAFDHGGAQPLSIPEHCSVF